MPKRTNPVAMAIVGIVLVLIAVRLLPYAGDDPHFAGVLGGLTVLVPFAGFGYAILRFVRWHRRFHARMKEDGLWRRPASR